MTTLAEPLDAYGQWLEIPPHEQPADHYRLLGLARFETDAARITAAADERMARVRSFQLGPHAALSQRILNELSAARATLLDARRRVSYDLVLRSAGPASSEAWPPGAQPALPSGELAAGTVIDGYRIVEKATSTMLGVTYKAQDVESRRPVFLKTLSPKAARKQEVRKRFQREIEILTRLDHPNLIVARHSGEHRGLPYLVMDYVVGADLSRLVRDQGPLAIDQAIDYVVQTARGLGELHLRGVIHRNIKPHALLVDLRGNLRITNLLLAKIGDSSLILSEDEDLTTQGESMGSIDYLPPEQAIDASKADERSDIYALGCTLFYLVTAQPPYAMKSPVDKLLAHRQAPIPSLRRLRSEAPAWLDAACQKMLAKWPADRYQQVSDVIRDLTQPPEQRPLWSRLLNWLGWRKK
jgi:serine/threonine protein kinase